MKKLFCLLLLIFMNVYSVEYTEFTPELNITTQSSSGIGFYVQNKTGTYDMELSIYDNVGNLLYFNKIPNFVIVDEIPYYICDTWNLLTKENKVAAAGYTYAVHFKMINKATGSTFTKDTKFGIKASNEKFVNIISCNTGDKLIASKDPFIASNTNSSNTAILLLEGNDALNQFSGLALEGKYRMIGTVTNRDLYIVDWKDSGASIYINAQNTVSIIQQLVRQFKYSEIVLIGKSLGGVIGRLALSKAETEGISLPVKKFISLDAPQQGVQINLTAQAAVYSIAASYPDYLASFPFFGGTGTARQYKNGFLSRPSSRETQYYHIGLVEDWVRNGVFVNGCPIKDANVSAARKNSSVWHDEFYASIKKYGNKYGYPKLCKNYAISYSNGNLKYNGYVPDQYIADFTTFNYHIYSDIQDLNQGSFSYNPNIDNQLSMKPGYSNKTVLVPLESALDLQNMNYAKTKGIYNRNLTYKEMAEHSPFDKIYVKANGNDHMSAMDGEILTFIKEIVEDNTPKINKVIASDLLPIIINLLD